MYIYIYIYIYNIQVNCCCLYIYIYVLKICIYVFIFTVSQHKIKEKISETTAFVLCILSCQTSIVHPSGRRMRTYAYVCVLFVYVHMCVSASWQAVHCMMEKKVYSSWSILLLAASLNYWAIKLSSAWRKTCINVHFASLAHTRTHTHTHMQQQQ